MWHLKLSGGVEVSEQQMRNWDQVPNDAEIHKAAVIFQRPGDLPYVIEMSGYDRYCVARCVSVGFASVGGDHGYCLYGTRSDQVTELEVLPSGMRLKMYSFDQCQLPEHCWRNGSRV